MRIRHNCGIAEWGYSRKIMTFSLQKIFGCRWSVGHGTISDSKCRLQFLELENYHSSCFVQGSALILNMTLSISEWKNRKSFQQWTWKPACLRDHCVNFATIDWKTFPKKYFLSSWQTKRACIHDLVSKEWKMAAVLWFYRVITIWERAGCIQRLFRYYFSILEQILSFCWLSGILLTQLIGNMTTPN